MGCKESCPLKIQRDDPATHTTYYAFRKSCVLNRAIIVREGLCPEVRDIAILISEILVMLEIEERIRNCFNLELPWVMVGHFIHPPEHRELLQSFTYNAIFMNDKLYGMPPFFWMDDFYFSRNCHCKELKARFMEWLRENSHQLRMTESEEEEEYRNFLNNSFYNGPKVKVPMIS